MDCRSLQTRSCARGSFIPPEEIRQLRDLCRCYHKLTWNAIDEKNRAQNCLTVSNLTPGGVFSDVFDESSSAIISFMLEHPGESFGIAPFMNKRCKGSPEDVQLAADGLFSPWQAEKLKVIWQHIAPLGQLRSLLEALIFKPAQPFKRQMELLPTVSGISNSMTAVRIIAEIGVEMSQFESSKYLCFWTGLAP